MPFTVVEPGNDDGISLSTDTSEVNLDDMEERLQRMERKLDITEGTVEVSLNSLLRFVRSDRFVGLTIRN